MTAILGFADGTNVWMAGDSACLNSSNDRYRTAEHKVFKRGNILIGSAGTVKAKQVIKNFFVAPEQKSMVPLYYLVTLFLPALKACLEEHQSSLKENDVLIGYCGELYFITHDYACTPIFDRVYAIGTGGDLALGAFKAYKEYYQENESPMLKALDIARQHNYTVSAPYYVEKI